MLPTIQDFKQVIVNSITALGSPLLLRLNTTSVGGEAHVRIQPPVGSLYVLIGGAAYQAEAATKETYWHWEDGKGSSIALTPVITIAQFIRTQLYSGITVQSPLICSNSSYLKFLAFLTAGQAAYAEILVYQVKDPEYGQ